MLNYNLIVIDLDTLVACERHVEDHGCELSDNTVYERSTGVADALAKIIDEIRSNEMWILLAPNTGCSNMLRTMLERYAEMMIESSTYNPIVYGIYYKLINLFNRGIIRETITYKDKQDIHMAIKNFLGNCLNIRANNKCRSIEKRVECIISRLRSPYSPSTSYILFCSERTCDDVEKKYNNKISCCKPIYKSERNSTDVYILFIYSKR